MEIKEPKKNKEADSEKMKMQMSQKGTTLHFVWEVLREENMSEKKAVRVRKLIS